MAGNLLRSLTRLLMGRRAPQREGSVNVRGCDAPVTISRDDNGIPTIQAATDDDAWFGLGFCHAQDRAGQLEITARVLRGTLAAVTGEESLSLDRLSRRVGFRRAAQGQFDAARPEVQRQLEAYARGVNAGFESGGGWRAPELALLGCNPTLWDRLDPQAMCVLLCFSLASNWDMELVRFQIARHDGEEAVRKLDPGYLDHLPVSRPPGEAAGPDALDRLAADLARFADVFAAGQGGSNAWAVAPSRTATGRPILANDPHLMPMAPCYWYLAHVQTPEWRAAGATFVGLPAIGVGHNGSIAWGATAAHCDNTDLFVERLAAGGRHVVGPGGEVEACDVRREVIRVRGRADVVEEVVVTPRGPIVSPALDGVADRGDLALSMAATWLEPRRYTGFFGAHTAGDVESFREVFCEASTSTGAMVVAEESGRIAWLVTCEVPRRRDRHGTMPGVAWDPSSAWCEPHVAATEMPWSLDPANGFVATANNPPVEPGRDDTPYLGVDFLDGFRQAEICARLDGRNDWTLAATRALQLDVRSRPWAEMRDVVLALRPPGDAARTALGLLRRWDGRMSADSPAASVFALFVTTLGRRVVERWAPNAAHWASGQGFTTLIPHNLLVTRRLRHLVELVDEQPDGWFDDWSATLTACLASAVHRLRRGFGDDPASWAWGEVRSLHAHHPFGDKPILSSIFNGGPVSVGGDSSTIAATIVDPFDPLGNPVAAPTLRAIIDVGAWSNSRFVVFPGQDGNPLSDGYEAMTEAWRTNQGVPIAWTSEEIAASTVERLVLEPVHTGPVR